MDRRQFCTSGLATASFAVAPFSSFAASGLDLARLDLARIERPRVLRLANASLSEQPITVTASHSDRSPGGPHDYFSEGDYWWPNPADPDGPYIQRDGQSNPANFNDHRLALIRLSLQMPALTAAWKITGQKRYAAKAADHLRAWFITPATRMNPNLQYAQAIHKISTGRNFGIIDTLHLIEVARAVTILKPALPPAEYEATLAWFSEYLTWLTTSQFGQLERDTKNNHAVTWLLQAAEFAHLTGNIAVTEDCRTRLTTILIPNQIAPDGSLPQELARTKPYSYALFCLDAFATCAQVLSAPSDNTLWTSIGPAIAFMTPFIRNKTTWPYKHDIEHWEEFPVRQPSLLFGGLALHQPAWIALWKTLDPDPTSPEVIRNFPIRQPILWV
ncbi:Alginate lyase [Granulicella pectinivorans]|uniref:Alginate lyase n=1 Tax=Granulicella pectinivorans TaxID=474950 RepID=A0A1I6M0Z7_9BACT|nr:alginate lyase family protein [Granulicella pectinivorans]SFS09396.1 Alginate lyase [Granulicella pectinivorans]